MKSKWKLVTFLGLVLLLVSSVVGCNQTPAPSEPTPTPVPTPEPTPKTPSIEQQLYNLTISITPPGAGFVSYPSNEYESGTQVELTAIPAKDHAFNYWAGDASGSSTTITIVMDSDKNITAHFERLQPSIFSGMDIHDVLESTATIQWHTNEIATFLVEYGTSDAYGSLNSDTVWKEPTDWGRVVLTGLKPQVTYHFRVLAVDTDGNQATSDDYTFTTLTPKGIYSARLFPFAPGIGDSAIRLNTSLFNGSSQTITVTKIEFLYEDESVIFTLPTLTSDKYVSPTLGRSDLPELWQNWQLPAGELLFTGMELDTFSTPLRELIGRQVKWYFLDAKGVEFTVTAEFSLLP